MIENNKQTYDIIIDGYKDKIFTDKVQRLLNGNGINFETNDDIEKIVEKIQNEKLIC